MPVKKKKTSTKVSRTVKAKETKTVTSSKKKTTKGKSKKFSAVKFNDMIRERAYYIWEEWGRPDGREQDIWSQAEKDINALVNK